MQHPASEEEATVPPVAIAVVSWNTCDLLRRCLDALARDVAEGRAEVWVVDNGSTDGSRDLVRSEFHWAHLLEPERNLGFGPAVNLAAERTAAAWIACANADVEIDPGALQALVDAGSAHPEAAVVAPKLILPDGSVQHSVYAFPSVLHTMLLAVGVHRLSVRLADRLCVMGRWDATRSREVDWAIGAFLLVRRAAFDQIGGFDPSQWLFAEDLDLGWRARRAGWVTRYEPCAAVRHHESAATSAAFGDARTARTMEATYAWIERRMGRVVAWAIALVNCLSMGLRLAVLGPLARLFPRFRARRDRARFWLRIHAAGLRA